MNWSDSDTLALRALAERLASCLPPGEAYVPSIDDVSLLVRASAVIETLECRLGAAVRAVNRVR